MSHADGPTFSSATLLRLAEVAKPTAAEVSTHVSTCVYASIEVDFQQLVFYSSSAPPVEFWAGGQAEMLK